MITPELKDQILEKIKSKSTEVFIDRSFFNHDEKELYMIVRQFAKRGFITITEETGYGYMTVRMEADGYDLLRLGGHVFEETIMGSNIKKLDLEIRKLEKDIPADKFDIITKTIGAIAAGVGIYSGLK